MSNNEVATLFALLILSPIFIYEKSFKAFLKFGNTLRGTKTEISKKTLLFGKIIGFFALISAILGLISFYFIK